MFLAEKCYSPPLELLRRYCQYGLLIVPRYKSKYPEKESENMFERSVGDHLRLPSKHDRKPPNRPS